MDYKAAGRAYAALIITFTLWGSLYVVSKFVLGKLPVFTVAFLRFAIAFVTLFIMGQKRPKGKILRGDHRWLLLIGVGGYFIAVGAQLLGTKYAGAALASLLNSLNPVTMTVLAAVFLGERFTARKAIGLLLALAGVYVIIGRNSNGSLAGIIMSLFAVLVWSLVSVLVRKVTGKYDSLLITQWGVLIAAICYLPLCIAELAAGAAVRPDGPGLLALFYMGAVCTGGAYYLWNRSLAVLEASRCSAFYPLQPVVSAGLGILFLGEQTSWAFWGGTVLIAVGLLVNLSGGGAKNR